MAKELTNDEKDYLRIAINSGMIAGPLYIGLALFQIFFLRPGFDLLKHDVSLLSNGPLGWIQMANFFLTGTLVYIAATCIRKALKGGAKWASLMLNLYGLGLVAAGVMVADPMNGFPPDSTTMNVISTEGILHLVFGAVGFIGLITSCFLFAKHFYKHKDKIWGHFSLATGVLFFLAFFGIASGSQPGSPLLTPVTLGFWVALL